MKVLITGICGFAGSALARALRERFPDWTISGFDNLSRPGSELNRPALQHLGLSVIHGDMRAVSDLKMLPEADWIIDAAANPSVLAGTDGKSSSRQLLENNLFATVNLLEHCRERRCGLVLLSSSRVYSIEALSQLEVQIENRAFQLLQNQLPRGVGVEGVDESFSTTPPLSLYGSSKLASENLALEYHYAFDVPIWIDRCGVFAGAGQFGRPDQGIFSFWINSYLRKRPLRYIGFGGDGFQVRDCLHPRDLAMLLAKQMQHTDALQPRLVNVSGGRENCISLAQLSDWCAARFGPHQVVSEREPRRFDVPWLVLDSRLAAARWNWTVESSLESILEEIAVHAESHPEWLEISGG